MGKPKRVPLQLAEQEILDHLRVVQLSDPAELKRCDKLIVESFLDPKLYQGTAYKVSGWSDLGRTAGWKRDADDFYLRHDSPKQIWVRELVRKACVKLCSKELPEEWAKVEAGVAAKCTFKVEPILSLMELFEKQPFSPSAHAQDPSADT